MIGRYLFSGVIVIAVYIAAVPVSSALEFSSLTGTAMQFVGIGIALIALAPTRSWGRAGRILFRARPADERESRLLAETDSVSIKLFLVVGVAAATLFLVTWTVVPSHWQAAWLASRSNWPQWFNGLHQSAVLLQSTYVFIVLHAIVGAIKFARDR